MGLDVKVYNNIRIPKNKDEGNFEAFVDNAKWEYKIKNLQKDTLYVGDSVFHGISYSYSSHNRFREILIKLIDRKDLLDEEGRIKWNMLSEDIPFYDFIDFSDCMGCLDWEISEVIYSDFEKYKSKAKKLLNEYDYLDYTTWLETFKIAKDRGVVVFS